MENTILYLVCVIYNKKITDIVSYKQFLDFSIDNECVHLIVVDNSTIDNVVVFNKSLEKEFVYISAGENVGLSKAYNLALKYIDEQNLSSKYLWLMIADDDTYFSSDYLLNLLCTITDSNFLNSGCFLISTNIKSNDRNMSPFTIKGIRVKAFEGTVGNYYENLYAINSGLCIKRELLKLVGDYNESLFLDYVDVLLFDRIKAIGRNRLLLIDGDVKQEFSAHMNTQYKNVLGRYYIFKKDFITYCSIVNKSKFFTFSILTKRRINIFVHNVKHIIHTFYNKMSSYTNTVI